MNSVEGNRQFAEAISAKFMLQDDKDDQDILDQHVSRVWSDMTPHRSPGNHSPSAQLQRKKPHELGFMPGGSKISSLFLKFFSLFHTFPRYSIVDALIKVHARLKYAEVQQMGQRQHRQRHQFVFKRHDDIQKQGLDEHFGQQQQQCNDGYQGATHTNVTTRSCSRSSSQQNGAAARRRSKVC